MLISEEMVPSIPIGGSGYDRIGYTERQGWRAVPSWGLDGWDLGSWPLVIVYHKDEPGRHGLRYDVEGDISERWYSDRAERDRNTDTLAMFHWRHEDADWLDRPAEDLSGPFSWARLKDAGR